MIKVKSRGNETAEQMLRRFKKMCEKEGLTKDIKRIAYYEKPSEKRRRQARTTRRPPLTFGIRKAELHGYATSYVPAHILTASGDGFSARGRTRLFDILT